MQNVESIINTLLTDVIKQDNVLGVLLTGSYAKGMQHQGSDMDVIVVTSNSSKTRMRGNVFIDGVLVEYYCNPFRQVRKYFAIDWLHNNPMIYLAYGEGLILKEKFGVLTKLKNEAHEYSKKSFAPLAESRISFEKYVIEDTKNKMISLAKKQYASFDYSYHTSLRSIYEFYARYLRAPILKNYMLEDYFNENIRFAGQLDPFPDSKFSKLYLDAITTVCRTNDINAKCHAYCEVADHVQNSTGPFKFDGWTLTIPVDYSDKMDTRSRVF